MLNFGLRWIGGMACLFLITGCVHYRLGIAFDWLGKGNIEQILRIDPALAEASGSQMRDLTQQLSLRTEKLGGKALWLDDELHLVTPFANSTELNKKINQFLDRPISAAPAMQPAPAQIPKSAISAISPGPFHLETNNHWLWTEYKVVADLDLRNPFHASGSEAFLSAIGAVNFEFALTTPLIASHSNASEQDGNTLIWHLQLEQVNHLEAGFNIPNWQLLLVLPLGGGIFLLWKKVSPPNFDAN